MKLYDGQKILILTKHKKEKAMIELLKNAIGGDIKVYDKFDTDKLGTFSREVSRISSQKYTARKKIRIGIKKCKEADVIISSEGSFTSHPDAPIPWNIELVMFYDVNKKMEVYGYYAGPETNHAHVLIENYEEVLKFANEVGFPSHHLIMRPDSEKSKHIIKEIKDTLKLKEAFDDCVLKSKKGKIFIETDMRAYANPTRMKNIEKATKNLIDNILNFCPNCQEPGFVITEVIRGLPCSQCGFPSDFPLEYVYSCWKCNNKLAKENKEATTVNPMYCHNCNP